jgi:hypothetical protein
MPDEDRTPTLTGGCQCGAVRHTLYAAPPEPGICHCRMCPKAFGNYFAPLAGVPLGDFAWTRGEPGVFKSSELVERGFCRDFGAPLFVRSVVKDASRFRSAASTSRGGSSGRASSASRAGCRLGPRSQPSDRPWRVLSDDSRQFHWARSSLGT